MFLQLILVQLLLSVFYFHPIHVSITNMDIDEQKKEITLSTKIFKDDFRLLFNHLNQIDIDFEDTVSIKINKDLIESYYNKSLKVFINNKIQELRLTDFQTKEDAVWLFGKVEINETIHSIKIRNTVLLDLYFDQKNLLILSLNKKDYAYQFNIKETEFKINEF